MTNGTGRGGSMDWQNATRARLHLETLQDEEGGTSRVLEVKKTNYGPAGEKVRLCWEDGCFVPQNEPPAASQSAAYSAVDFAYLTCLDVATAQGRRVREHAGRGYAPRVFADMPEAQGMTMRAFKAAQERLFSTGVIHNQAEGPPSKRTHFVARKPPAKVNAEGVS